MVTVDFDGIEATVENGEWSCSDPDLKELLTSWTQTEIDTAAPGSPFFNIDSPSNPWPDFTIAQEAAKAFDGKIISKSPPQTEENEDFFY